MRCPKCDKDLEYFVTTTQNIGGIIEVDHELFICKKCELKIDSAEIGNYLEELQNKIVNEYEPIDVNELIKANEID